MEARNVKPRFVTFAALVLCVAPASVFAQNADGYTPSAPSAPGLQEPSLSRPETWLRNGNPPRTAAEPAVTADAVVAPKPDSPTAAHGDSGGATNTQSAMSPNGEPAITAKPDTALLPFDAESATRENDSERSVPRGAREAARDPCLRSSDPKCYERHKDHYHPYLGYVPGTPVSTLAPVGATSVSSAGGAVGARITPASAAVSPAATAAPRTLEQPLVFFDPPPKKHRRGK
jgi:hypothetical protein